VVGRIGHGHDSQDESGRQAPPRLSRVRFFCGAHPDDAAQAVNAAERADALPVPRRLVAFTVHV
jgi:hypothetical protein